MKTKDETVNIWDLQVEMQPVLKNSNAIWKSYGEELVITSGRDGIHSAGSLHYYGYAVDLRIWRLEGKVDEIADILRAALGDDYDVIIHKTHIHVEYQAILEKICRNSL